MAGDGFSSSVRLVAVDCLYGVRYCTRRTGTKIRKMRDCTLVRACHCTEVPTVQYGSAIIRPNKNKHNAQLPLPPIQSNTVLIEHNKNVARPCPIRSLSTVNRDAHSLKSFLSFDLHFHLSFYLLLLIRPTTLRFCQYVLSVNETTDCECVATVMPCILFDWPVSPWIGFKSLVCFISMGPSYIL